MLEQLKICSPYVRQTRPLCCQALWLRCAGGVGSVGKSVGSVDKSVGSVGKSVGSVGKSVGSAGKSVGSVDKSVGISSLYTLRNALKIN